MAGKGTKKGKDMLQLLISIATVILLNYIGSFYFFRLDLTAEKRHSLSDATIEFLNDLDDVVYVKVYLEGDFPAEFQKLRNATKEKLDNFRAYANGNLEYEFINPSASEDLKTNEEIYHELTKKGLQYNNIKIQTKDGVGEKIIFPGAILTYKEKEIPVQLLKSQMGVQPEIMVNNSINNLEYELSNSIRKFLIDSKQKIAFIEGHGELNSLQVADFKQTLEEYYVVDRVKIDGLLSSLDGYQAIVIAKPDSVFNDKDKFIIDQFIMKGGSAMWLIDPVQANKDSLRTSSMALGVTRYLNIEDQLFKYGVRLNHNLIQDLQCGAIPITVGYTGNQPRTELFPWFFDPLMIPQSKHPIVNNLDAIKGEFTSTIDTIASSKAKKTVLLTSSRYSRVMNSPVRISLRMVDMDPNKSMFNKPFLPVAVLLEGKFESSFKNTILPPEIKSSPDIAYREESEGARMIIIADGDIMKSHTTIKNGEEFAYPLGKDQYSNAVYGNKDFLLNCMNYLMDDSGLISVRSRELKLRLLDQTRIIEERFFWQFINVGVPILVIIVFGFIQFYIRKGKYSS